MGNKFIELWQESTIIQGILALSCVGVILYMAIIQAPIPDFLTGLVGIVIGYYFGSKSTQQVRGLLNSVSKKGRE